MLKTFPSIIATGATSAKCGEIFCQSAKSFTIVCTFCEMKTFEFEDFLLHFKNVHFENNLLKTEEIDIQCTPYLDVSVKCEPTFEEGMLQEHCDNDPAVDDSYEVEEDENLLTIWKKTKKKTHTFNGKNEEEWSGIDEAPYADEDFTGDEDKDYKPRKERKTKQKLNVTVTKAPAKQHKCEICNKFYKTATVLKVHTRKVHSEAIEKKPEKEKPEINCPVCAKVFYVYCHLEKHCTDEHGGIPCEHCGKKFRTRYDLRIHLTIHSEVKSFVCEFEGCGKRFCNAKRLRSHLVSHNEFKKYICDTCGYSCRLRSALQVHIRTHTGEKPYPCQLCGKRFISHSQLNDHMGTHQTLRPYVCDVCGASFALHKSLYHHKHLHLGIKKFKCKICGNAYAQASGLAGHMRKHREEGVF